MAIHDVKVPQLSESVAEATLLQWKKKPGDAVAADEILIEIETDKVVLEVPAPAEGVMSEIVKGDGGTVVSGEVIAKIDTEAKAGAGAAPAAAPAKAAPAVVPAAAAPTPAAPVSVPRAGAAIAMPSAAKLMAETGVVPAQGTGKDGRITKQDVLAAMSAGFSTEATQGWGGTREQSREKMSMLRRKIAERLVSVKNETAMLTTFNEVDMKPIMDIRAKYKDAFAKHHEVNLGFMSFFTKAVTEALKLFPAVNAQIDGNEMIFHDYADIGIAVSSPKGLMVPVVRNAEQMSLADIEREIKRLAIKARDGKITPEDMSGGTFTITNGGVFGSMLSTPIINPPQSAILGMHNVVERPVAINGKVEIRPIMYVALSYDHRIIDGKESVGFLVKVKEMLENPERMIFGSKDPMEILLGL